VAKPLKKITFFAAPLVTAQALRGQRHPVLPVDDVQDPGGEGRNVSVDSIEAFPSASDTPGDDASQLKGAVFQLVDQWPTRIPLTAVLALVAASTDLHVGEHCSPEFARLLHHFLVADLRIHNTNLEFLQDGRLQSLLLCHSPARHPHFLSLVVRFREWKFNWRVDLGINWSI